MSILAGYRVLKHKSDMAGQNSSMLRFLNLLAGVGIYFQAAL
jgi:hypothetical protein